MITTTSTLRHGRWVHLIGPLQMEHTRLTGAEHGTIVHERPDNLGRTTVRVRLTDGRELNIFATEIEEDLQPGA